MGAPMPEGEARDAIPAEEVAKLLGISRNSVYSGAGLGEIPCRRVGRRLIFSRKAIEFWLLSASRTD